MRKLRDLFVARSSSIDKRLAEEIEILHKSPLFDPVWYRQTYFDLRDTPIDVARHYLEQGAAEGRNPHPLFDTKFYLAKNPDVAAARMNPLVHYILYGSKEGRDTHPNSSDASNELSREAGKLGWFHSIPLPGGSFTHGHKTIEQLTKEAQLWQFPADLSRRSVLDIGCADGYWSVLALRRGAKEVVAIDEKITGGLQFLLDHKTYPIDFRNMDLFSADFLNLPAFDFVIFAGVLYHTKNPLEALTRLRRVTKGVALIETHLDHRFGENASYAIYYEQGECNNDPTNWWGPSSLCVEAMLRTTGFSRIERTSFYHSQPPFDRGSYLAYVS